MSERDERGRLRLPRQDLVPFQRVLSRSNRSSRRPTPDKSGHISRSHSYNGQEVSRGLARLSLNNNNNNNNGHKTRTHSHEHATTTKAPRIPFQRVLHRRRTHTHTLQPQVSTQEGRYRDIRNRRREEGGLFRPFATEYHTKYMSGGQVKSRRKPSRYKNQSQLSSVIKDPTLPQSQGEERDEGDRGDGESSNPSETSSVKLPKIRDSPLTAPHSPDLHDPRPNTHAGGRQSSGTRSMDTHQDTEPRPHTEPRPVSRAESRPGESRQHSHTDIYTVPSPDTIPQMST
ncbi:hypothetical protein Pcinc_025370 [Petrolisthes cinctipes]|uniref:Uncharacterized protein n=1 Tax=Petrolisthes cinctipes TaxID=88211 RepID=A0AAE1F8N9_PETCI|nr:hypothetical protein Pcinc_025370 [Petrolisthes cinctipes]